MILCRKMLDLDADYAIDMEDLYIDYVRSLWNAVSPSGLSEDNFKINSNNQTM